MSNATASSLPEVGGALTSSLPQHWPAAVASVIFATFVFLAQFLFKIDHLAKVPFVGEGGEAARRQQFVTGKASELYREGYRKFKNGVFRITTSRKMNTVVVSPIFLDELRKLPDDVVSFNASIKETMQADYTMLNVESKDVVHAVRSKLTPALPRITAAVADEVEDAVRDEMPATNEWTEVNINSKLLAVVAKASGRVFIGSEHCRNEGYLDFAINYTVELMEAVRAVSDIPWWQRPLKARFIPEVKQLKERIAQADAFLRPIVSDRLEAGKSMDYQKPEDMLQWIMDVGIDERDEERLAKAQLDISFAAIHTTTTTTTNAFYWLAAMPELVPMLREDVQNALFESGGAWTSLALQNMKKLDSFLKEVLRCSPLGAASFERKVLKDITLSNGQVIPAGTIIEVPLAGIVADESIWQEPEKFDALRHYKLRQQKSTASSTAKAAEMVASAQLVGVGHTSLQFGYGRHACPGRFFAAHEIKMIMATFLMHYDVKMPGDSKERYPNLIVGRSSVPDPTKNIMVRKAQA